jgi:hypothetical protein
MERLRLLDGLGFVWNAPRGAKRKCSTMTIENEGNVIQDHKDESRNVKIKGVSLEPAQSIESGLNRHSESELKVTRHEEENLQKQDTKHSLQSADLSAVNQGMFR